MAKKSRKAVPSDRMRELVAQLESASERLAKEAKSTALVPDFVQGLSVGFKNAAEIVELHTRLNEAAA